MIHVCNHHPGVTSGAVCLGLLALLSEAEALYDDLQDGVVKPDARQLAEAWQHAQAARVRLEWVRAALEGRRRD